VFLLGGLSFGCSESSNGNSNNEKSICDYVDIQKKCLTDIINKKSYEHIINAYRNSKKEFKHLIKTSDSRMEVVDELKKCIKNDEDYYKLKKQADEISRRQGWDDIPGVLPEFEHGNDPLNSRAVLIDFGIRDTSAISKIIITDPTSRSIKLIREKNSWTNGKGECIAQYLVQNILDITKNIEWIGYLPVANYESNIDLSNYHSKVEFYKKGNWSKTWYFGPPSDDHYGQVMLLSTNDAGKSSEPVIMKIRGVHGIIEPNFFADSRQWDCTAIFSLSKDQIEQVELINNEDPNRSFRIDKIEKGYNLSRKGKILREVDLAMLNRYLENYKKIHFDDPNYELNKRQCDSVRRTEPFCELKLKETNGNSTHLKMFRIQLKEFQRDEFGEIVNIDMNKFWCELPDGTLVKCQYHVFNPLIMGSIYFPYLDR